MRLRRGVAGVGEPEFCVQFFLGFRLGRVFSIDSFFVIRVGARHPFDHGDEVKVWVGGSRRVGFRSDLIFIISPSCELFWLGRSRCWRSVRVLKTQYSRTGRTEVEVAEREIHAPVDVAERRARYRRVLGEVHRPESNRLESARCRSMQVEPTKPRFQRPRFPQTAPMKRG